MPEHDVAQYWENRFARGPALSTTGFIGFGASFNVWMYRVRRAQFLARMHRAMRRSGIDAARANVLDVGSGSGFYIERWLELGVKSLSACDLTDASAQSLAKNFPNVSFERLDIGTYDAGARREKYDAVSCMDVLFHIVDDNRYAAAIANISAMLRPGGLFVFTENCLHGSAMRSAFQVSRPLSQIEAYLGGAQLRVLSRAPVFVLMNTPLDSTNALLRAYWAALRVIVGHLNFAGAFFGAVLYWPERWLAEVVREGPSTEMLICERVA